MNYNPSEQDYPYRTVRFCISDDVLVEVATEYELAQGQDLDEIALEALVEKLKAETSLVIEPQ